MSASASLHLPSGAPAPVPVPGLAPGSGHPSPRGAPSPVLRAKIQGLLDESFSLENDNGLILSLRRILDSKEVGGASVQDLSTAAGELHDGMADKGTIGHLILLRRIRQLTSSLEVFANIPKP